MAGTLAIFCSMHPAVIDDRVRRVISLGALKMPALLIPNRYGKKEIQKTEDKKIPIRGRLGWELEFLADSDKSVEGSLTAGGNWGVFD
ncbi:MAG TPA: hypothetical protein PLT20_08150, partial [Sedimentisphaerales bacterium]|nr:hypothetical protein [Sedimentisphaerales bacterium]